MTENTLHQRSLIEQSVFLLSKKRDFISIGSICRYANGIKYFGWFDTFIVRDVLENLGAINVNRNVYDVSKIDSPFNYLDMTEKGCYVYMITDGENVKIGHSKTPYKRMKSLQTGNPKKLSMLYLFNHTGYLFEQYLHYKFKNYKLKNEWFKMSDEIIEYANNELDQIR